jgi:2-hydroxychromene-2-carboxylate isomerase
MHDSLFADQARLEDPHLWERARRIGLDLERFDQDRRGEVVRARVAASFRAGVRAGVVTTPTLFLSSAGEPAEQLSEDGIAALLAGAGSGP